MRFSGGVKGRVNQAVDGRSQLSAARAETWQVGGVPVTVQRSPRRRTVALQVLPGQVRLLAPSRVPLADLERVLETRRAWVEGHLRAFEQQARAAWRALDGATLPFLGDTLTLAWTPGLAQAKRVGCVLHVPVGPGRGSEGEDPDSEAQASAHVAAWTKAACAPAYRAVVADAAAQLGASERLGRVLVATAARRWGSCTARGDIRLHWKLSRAPLDVLHYVALHEAAHLLELNHSPPYWAHVARVMPEYAARRAWLREHGHTL